MSCCQRASRILSLLRDPGGSAGHAQLSNCVHIEVDGVLLNPADGLEQIAAYGLPVDPNIRIRLLGGLFVRNPDPSNAMFKPTNREAPASRWA